MPISTVLVPLDGSQLSEKALNYLPALREIGQIRVTLTSVALDEDSRPVVSSYLDELAAKIRASSGLAVDWVTHSGVPYAHVIA